jgi:predicted permease
MWTDLRHVFKGWRTSRGIVLSIVASLAIGVGAGAVVFGAVETVFFGKPAGVSIDGLVTIHTSQFNGGRYGPTSYPDFLSLQSTNVTGMAAYDDAATAIVSRTDVARTIRVSTVSGGFFDLLGIQPAAGRLLRDTDTLASSAIAVISFDLWTDLGSPAIADELLVSIDGRTVSVVGVASPLFRGLTLGRFSDVWIPIDISTASDRGDRRYRVVARLKSGVPVGRLENEVRLVAGELSERFPESNRGTRESADSPRLFFVVPFSFVDPAARRGMSVVAAVLVVGTVLLFVSACANAGSLLLARTMAQQRELALKIALGANRWTLARQILLECCLLTVVATLAGLAVAYVTSGVLPSLLYAEDARMLEVRMGWRVVALLVVIGVSGSLLFGLAPAVSGTRLATASFLRSGADPSFEGSTVRLWLLASQVGVCTVLVVGAGWATLGLSSTLRSEYPLASPEALLATIRLPTQSSEVTPSVMLSSELLEIPGVVAAGAATTLPLGRAPTRGFRVFAPGTSVSEVAQASIKLVTADYFWALNVPTIHGRSFRYDDNETAIVVNESFARRYLGLTALEDRVQEAGGRNLRVLGVVRDELYRVLQGTPEPTVYYLLDRYGPTAAHIIARTRATVTLDDDEVRRRLVARGATVTRVIRLERHLSEALATDRLAAMLVSIYAALALTVALIAVHGIAGEVLQRRRIEVAVRVVLGASASHLVSSLFMPAVAAAAAGAMIGILCAHLLMSVGVSLVFGLPPITAPTMLTSYVLMLGAVAAVVLATVLRALKANPAQALRGH